MNKNVAQIAAKYLSRYLDSRMVFAMDFILSSLSSLLALFFAMLLSESGIYSGAFTWVWLILSVTGSLLTISLSHTYRMIIRHSTMRDMQKLMAAATVKGLFMLVMVYLLGKTTDLYTVSPHLWMLPVCDSIFTIVLYVGVRVSMISVYQVIRTSTRQESTRKKVLVYGTGEKSVALTARLKSSTHYIVVGMLTPDKAEHLTIDGIKVYTVTDKDSFASAVDSSGADALLFARPADAALENGRTVRYCSEMHLKSLVSPSIGDLESVEEHSLMREVRIEDLLGRDEIRISLKEIKSYFQDKTVLVTGAAGSIGSELCRQLAGIGVSRLVMFDNAETPMHNLSLEFDDRYKFVDYRPVIGDVRSVDRLDFVFRRYKPQVVFHAAAYKHVPLMEDNPCEAVMVNVVGSRNVADKCLQYGVDKMVMISTDKAVNPTNVMGCTKRLAEIYVQSLGLAVGNGAVQGHTRFITTRFGNVLGSNGSVIPRFRDQIAKGGPVTVTHPDINRFFMTIPEACRLVMEAAHISTGNQIVVFDMGEPVKIDDLAKRMIELSGFRPGIDIKISYTGLRPGEKLYEEVLSNVENTEPTSHDRIRIAKVREYAYEDACDALDKLRTLSEEVKIPETVQTMKQIVPEYISNNSKYEIYDKK